MRVPRAMASSLWTTLSAVAPAARSSTLPRLLRRTPPTTMMTPTRMRTSTRTRTTRWTRTRRPPPFLPVLSLTLFFTPTTFSPLLPLPLLLKRGNTSHDNDA